MKWFGENWGAPVCEPNDHVTTPVGKLCGGCREPLRENDRGVIMPFLGSETDDKEMAMHLRCFGRNLGIDLGIK
jgi:hypothetical protein